MDLLLNYIIVMEGDNLMIWRTKKETAMHRIQKGLKFFFSDLNSRYRNKTKNLLHKDLKDTKIYHLFSQP